MKVRLGTEKDYSTIKEICVDTIKNNYRSLMSEEQYNIRLKDADNWDPALDFRCSQNFLLVAEHNNRVFGFLIGTNNSQHKVTYIDQIRVDVNCQRQGIGNLLLKYMEDSIAKYKCIILTVSSNNKNAIDFYLKNGYTINNSYRDRRLLHKCDCDRIHSQDETFLC